MIDQSVSLGNVLSILTSRSSAIFLVPFGPSVANHSLYVGLYHQFRDLTIWLQSSIWGHYHILIHLNKLAEVQEPHMVGSS